MAAIDPQMCNPQNSSQLAAAASAELRKRFFCDCIQLAGFGISFDSPIETPAVKRSKPQAKTAKSRRAKPRNGSFNFQATACRRSRL